jgi:hypothetical protein
MAEVRLAAPALLEEHRKLAVFAGESFGDEMAYSSSPASGGRTQLIVRGLTAQQRGPRLRTYTMRIQFSPDAEGWADGLTGVDRRLY